MAVAPSAASLQQARDLLANSGVDLKLLSKDQIHAFAARSPEAQDEALQILLKKLNIQSDDEESSEDEEEDEDEDEDEDDTETSAAAEDLLDRCKSLVRELEEFSRFIKEHQREGLVEYRTFRNELKSEIKFLERIQKSDLSKEKIQHNVSSSNLPYYEALWAAAKSSSEVLTFRRWFYWDYNSSMPASNIDAERSRKLSKGQTPPSQARKLHSALVDCVAQNGRQWIKVSTITEKRLLMELAKQGWQNDSDSDNDTDKDEDDDKETNRIPQKRPAEASDDEDEISLLKIARDLARASRKNRARTHRPHIVFILPRVHRGRYAEVDRIITSITATGASVLCASDIPPVPPLPVAFPRMLVDESKDFTKTLNIDCTILLALVSDISHTDVEIMPWFHRGVRQQIEFEKTARLLPRVLYPLMRGRKLTCTAEAALRMKEIVETIGTDTERERTALFMEELSEGKGSNAATLSGEALRTKVTPLTNHPLPPDTNLPIHILPPFDLTTTLSTLPPVASKVADQLTPINQSVFLTGWAHSHTTLSSNATVAKDIEKAIDEARGVDEDEVVGPHVWLCEQSRSLVSKAGRGDAWGARGEGRSTVQEVIR